VLAPAYALSMTPLEPLEPRRLLANLPAGFVESTVASGFNGPTAMAFAPDGRLFVAEQSGALKVVKHGSVLPTPFVKLRVDARSERGLLGVAFDPNFVTNGFVYVYYTVPGSTGVAAHNRVSRFTASGDIAAKRSEQILLDLDDLTSAGNHNGGALAFGPDGKLYIGVGENNDGSNAQSFGNLLGKVLRINPDGTIPNDNPFLAQTTGKNQAIWAIGLRNPFSLAIARKGRMLINDVGEHTWEEINEGVRASNYGWPQTEGPTTRRRVRAPAFAYEHGDSTTTGNSIVGAAFYEPADANTFGRKFSGLYFFADLTSGWIRMFNPTTRAVGLFATGVSVPVALAVNDDGSLYYLERGSGDLVRVQRAGVEAARPATTFSVRPVLPAIHLNPTKHDSIFDDQGRT